MSLRNWTEVLVKAENKKDMTYSFASKNQYGQDVWGTKIRPLPGARNFLSGIGLKKNVDYDYTADKLTGEYCYKFSEPKVATMFTLWFDEDSPERNNTHSIQHTCPECGNKF